MIAATALGDMIDYVEDGLEEIVDWEEYYEDMYSTFDGP
jgi:hypothetical protein